MDSLTGVILCGGQSTRMGRDKGLILQGNTPWAEYMAEKLAPFNIPVVYSINYGQLEAYSRQIPGQFILDDLDLPGPLNGLLSVHKQLPSRDLLLLACDMPDLDTSTIGGVIEAYHSATKKIPAGDFTYAADFYVYQQEAFAQPFCGIYTSKGLSGVLQAAINGQTIDYSLQSLLKSGRTMRLTTDRSGPFRNYNSLTNDMD
jgi:molybdopterin-guanine dinucleotide biosynthesis protein A